MANFTGLSECIPPLAGTSVIMHSCRKTLLHNVTTKSNNKYFCSNCTFQTELYDHYHNWAYMILLPFSAWRYVYTRTICVTMKCTLRMSKCKYETNVHIIYTVDMMHYFDDSCLVTGYTWVKITMIWIILKLSALSHSLNFTK